MKRFFDRHPKLSMSIMTLFGGVLVALPFFIPAPSPEVIASILETVQFPRLYFTLLMVAQGIIAVIPAGATAVAGGLAFGTVQGVLYACVGVMTGSMLLFFIGRLVGKPGAMYLLSEETYDVYEQKVTEKGSPYLFTIFLVPFFPDDAFCFVAGMAGVKTQDFLWALTGRFPVLYAATAYGEVLITEDTGQIGTLIILITGVITVFYNRERTRKVVRKLAQKYKGR